MERNTRQRQAVLDALGGSGRTLSPPEILALAQRQAPGLNLSTVYRQVKALEEGGALMRVQLPGQPTRFEALCKDELRLSSRASHRRGQAREGAPDDRAHSTEELPHHHHHFHCLACDQVVPIHGCPGTMRDLAPPGCSVERHDLVLHGRCAACASQVMR